MAKWTFIFRNLSNSKYTITIDGAQTDTTCELAPDPLVMYQDSDKDLFKSVRTCTAQLNIFATKDEINEILNINNPFTRPVTIYKDDAVIWRGYVNNDSTSQDWNDVLKHYYTINLISCLDAIKQVDVDITKHGIITIREFLNEIILAAGGYDYVKGIKIRDTEDNIKKILARGIDRDNWITYLSKENEKGTYINNKKMYDVLEDILKVHGWQLYEYCNVWHIYRIGVQENTIKTLVIDTSSLASTSISFSYDMITPEPSPDAPTDSICTETVIPAKRSITVTGTDTPYDGTIWELDFDKTKFKGNKRIPDLFYEDDTFNGSILDYCGYDNTDEQLTINEDPDNVKQFGAIPYKYKSGQATKGYCSLGAVKRYTKAWYRTTIPLTECLAFIPRTTIEGSVKAESNLMFRINPRVYIPRTVYQKYLLVTMTGCGTATWDKLEGKANNKSPTGYEIQKVVMNIKIHDGEMNRDLVFYSYMYNDSDDRYHVFAPIGYKGGTYAKNGWMEAGNNKVMYQNELITSKYIQNDATLMISNTVFSLTNVLPRPSISAPITVNHNEKEPMTRNTTQIPLHPNTEGYIELSLYYPVANTYGWNPDDIIIALIDSMRLEIYTETLLSEEDKGNSNTAFYLVDERNNEDYKVECNLTCGKNTQKGRGCIYEFGDINPDEDMEHQWVLGGGHLDNAVAKRFGWKRATSLDDSGLSPEDSYLERIKSIYCNPYKIHTQYLRHINNPTPSPSLIGYEWHVADESAKIYKTSMYEKSNRN